MAPRKPAPLPDIIGTREAMKILDRDRATVIRWGELGRYKIVGRLSGQGSVLYDRASVEDFAATKNELYRRPKTEEAS